MNIDQMDAYVNRMLSPATDQEIQEIIDRICGDYPTPERMREEFEKEVNQKARKTSSTPITVTRTTVITDYQWPR